MYVLLLHLRLRMDESCCALRIVATFETVRWTREQVWTCMLIDFTCIVAAKMYIWILCYVMLFIICFFLHNNADVYMCNY